MAARGRSAVAGRCFAGLFVAIAVAVLQRLSCFVGFQASSTQPRRSNRVARGFFSKPEASGTATLERPQKSPARAPRAPRTASPKGLSVGSHIEVLFPADDRWYAAEVIQAGDEPTVKFSKDGYEYTTVAKTFRQRSAGAAAAARPSMRPRRRANVPAIVGEQRYADVLRVNEALGAAFVDIGASQDAYLHKSQLSTAFVSKVGDVLSEGDRVSVWITDKNENDGKITVTMINPNKISVTDADLKVGQKKWGVVKTVNSTFHGAFVDIGYLEDVFLHQSNMANAYVADPNEIVSVGRRIEVVIEKIEGDKIGISMAPASLEPEDLYVGKKVKAIVVRMNKTLSAAFLDFGGKQQGFLHVRETKKARAENIEDEVYKGQQVDAYIKKIDGDKVDLSLISPSLETQVTSGRLAVGKRVRGVVMRVNTKLNAAFVDIGAAEEAFLPASLAAPGFVEDISSVVWEGQQVTAWVDRIKDGKKVDIALVPPKHVQKVKYDRSYVGVVSSISEEHGLAFVDVGAEAGPGSLHISELRRRRGDKGQKVTDYVAVGQLISVIRSPNKGDDDKIRFKLEAGTTTKLKDISIGDELQGTVVNVLDSMGAAFVDIGTGNNALLNIADTNSELKTMSEIVSKDQEVTVYVKRLDMSKGEVSLTMAKDKLPNFAPFEEAFEARTVLDATVQGSNEKNVFLNVNAGGSQLVGRLFTENFTGNAEVGASVQVRVKHINARNGRLELEMA
eukprot:TRINITY_DN27602_c0_g1_i1.p1 TRINITY_DN27602_c0_g1~~TRINITY_DN27602_c0_g1_i1.p1  ORF type:complete len:754 (-),score=178.81 TRINITY_DN27602_c0_g1_i1:358-2556(-)